MTRKQLMRKSNKYLNQAGDIFEELYGNSRPTDEAVRDALMHARQALHAVAVAYENAALATYSDAALQATQS